MSYLLVEHRPPCCKGCSNEDGWCGTPCVDCDIIAKFKEEWEPYLYMQGKFVVYKKIASKESHNIEGETVGRRELNNPPEPKGVQCVNCTELSATALDSSNKTNETVKP